VGNARSDLRGRGVDGIKKEERRKRKEERKKKKKRKKRRLKKGEKGKRE